jgi:O-antigen ligase
VSLPGPLGGIAQYDRRMAMPRSRRARKPALVALALVWLVVIDSLNGVQLGPASVAGFATLGLAVWLAVEFVARASIVRSPHAARRRTKQSSGTSASSLAVSLPLLLFVLLAAVRLPFGAGPEGIQNVAVYALFVLGIPVASALVVSGGSERVALLVGRMGIIASAVFFVSSFAGSPIYSERAYALAALVSVAALVTRTTTGLAYWVPILLTLGAILYSQSRTALVVAVAMLVFSSLRFRASVRPIVTLLLVAATVALGYFLFFVYGPIRERVFGGDNAVVGGLQINTSGRIQFWHATIESWRTAPMFGHGPGSASQMIDARWTNVDHPHNDYLRVLHDFGWVGLALLVMGMIGLLIRLYSRARTHRRHIDWLALIALTSVLAAAATDNILVYPFVMLPTGVIVGFSLAPVGRTGGSSSDSSQVDAPHSVVPPMSTHRRNSRRRAAGHAHQDRHGSHG